MKSVLLSIKPKYCALIASEKKTVEVRKTVPKIETPFKCYIYCTLQGSNEFFQNLKNCLGEYEALSKWNREAWGIKKGKVIGEFICDGIISHCEMANADIAEQQGRIKREELLSYSNGKELYGWHISNLVIYDKQKELNESFVYCEKRDKRPIACKSAYEENNENGYYSECMCDFKRPIERPPQSWCYVEQLKD